MLVAEELGINARRLRRWRDAEKRDGEDEVRGVAGKAEAVVQETETSVMLRLPEIGVTEG